MKIAMTADSHKIAHTLLTFIIPTVMAACVLFSSCGLIYEYPGPCEEDSVDVIYNWDEIELDDFIMPEGMTTLFYPTDGSDYWRYELTPYGNNVEIPFGSYSVVGINNDTRNVIFRNEKSLNDYLAYSVEGKVIQYASGRKESEEPPAADEPVRSQPDMIYVAAPQSPFAVDSEHSTIMLYPKQFTPQYTVIVDDISNPGSIATATMSISSMSGGKYVRSGERMPEKVTIPGRLGIQGQGQLSGYLVNFGPSTSAGKNILTVYLWLRDNSKLMYRFDVTDQIQPHADALNLIIRVAGINLPEVGGNPDVGNMDVDVDGWVQEDIDISN